VPFFALTFAWTWSLWWGAVAAELSFDQPLFRLLYLLGGFVPLVLVAGTVTWWFEGRPGSGQGGSSADGPVRRF
jgi:hypothetical protein